VCTHVSVHWQPRGQWAIMQKIGSLIPNVAGLTSVISFLRDCPSLKNKDIRPHLDRHLPSRSQWNAQAITSSNFKDMIMKFLL